MKLRSKNLEDSAVNNTQVSIGTRNNNTILKKGVPNDHSVKHLNGRTIGMSLGSTINMENYESLRIDVWCTDTLLDNETQEQGYNRIKKVIDKVMRDTVDEYANN